MPIPSHRLSSRAARRRVLAGACAATLISACGGGQDEAAPAARSAAALSSTSTTLAVELPNLPAGTAALEALPAFDLAPVLLAEPDEADAGGASVSARHGPHSEALAAGMEQLATRRLTVAAIRGARALRAGAGAPTDANDAATPLAAAGVVATYTPAQIRAAYDLPALPAGGAALSAAQRAQLGAGQTIYIVDAMHDPNVAAELAAFNAKFGLPTCAGKSVATTASRPLAPAAAGAGCELSVVYSTAAGAMTAAAPAYQAGWATEIALDVQWAHATAPLARIVLIEAADASLNNLLGAVQLANALGPGVVSMSFGAAEGGYTASADSVFSGAGMSYLAATGDAGAGVAWPSVSPNVLAVGGTTLTYNGGGGRAETGWSGTGGGVSAYTATPPYQNAAVPGMGAPPRRVVADVAFNANPASGQYVAVIGAGGGAASWVSAGGTSLATPQWAGVVAVANAVRAQAAQAALGRPHAALYGQVASVPGYYAAAFADVTQGSNGACAGCAAKAGYDTLAGLGTPNGNSLLGVLSGAAAAATPPLVTSAAIAGKVGTPLTFTAAVTASNPVSYTLGGAPSGMVVASTGVVSWPTPLAGSYPVTLTARDSKTGLAGQGLYTVTVAAAPAPVVAPVVSAANVSGKPGTALSFSVAAVAPNPVTYGLGGAPAGMAINGAGVVSWPSPVLGNYAVTVTAKDGKTGLSGQAVIGVTIASAGPVITAPAMAGVAGKVLSGTIAVSAPGASGYSVTISGAPLGMGFAISGTVIVAQWPNAQVGNYALKVVAVDSMGRTATLVVPVTVTAR